jgi:hypothetical protein
MLDFPNSPSLNQLFPTTNPQWQWNGTAWTPYVLSQVSGLQVKVRVFTSTQTYAPTPGLQFAMVECLGGGGGGGGCGGAASQSVGSGGGASGSYSRSLLSAAQIGASQAITIGAAGSGGASGQNNGGTGGQTSFGALVTAPGGGGGVAGSGAASPSNGIAGAAGVGDFAIRGNDGGSGMYVPSATATAYGGFGAPSRFGGMACALQAASSASNGSTGKGYGAGGSGGASMGVATTASGGAGVAGVCIVTEFGNFGYVPPIFVMRSYLAGYTLSSPGSSSLFTAQPGQAADSTNADYISLTAAINKSTSAWAAGTGNGGLDTGAIAINTWYHVFAIKNPTTNVVDILISLSATAPTMPSGYTLFRRIGSIKTNSSSQWKGFSQRGDEFILTETLTQDVNTTTLGTTATPYTLASVPSGIQVIAMFRGSMQNAAGNAITISSPDELSVAVNTPAGNLTISNGAGLTVDFQLQLRTNTSQQIRAVSLNANTTFYVVPYGWLDRRGQDN